ncbi:hypothetical protein AAVH_42482, partial [Aphelenchoides avenae]
MMEVDNAVAEAENAPPVVVLDEDDAPEKDADPVTPARKRKLSDSANEGSAKKALRESAKKKKEEEAERRRQEREEQQ